MKQQKLAICERKYRCQQDDGEVSQNILQKISDLQEEEFPPRPTPALFLIAESEGGSRSHSIK
jgi:hypothetical protein